MLFTGNIHGCDQLPCMNVEFTSGFSVGSCINEEKVICYWILNAPYRRHQGESDDWSIQLKCWQDIFRAQVFFVFFF